MSEAWWLLRVHNGLDNYCNYVFGHPWPNLKDPNVAQLFAGQDLVVSKPVISNCSYASYAPFGGGGYKGYEGYGDNCLSKLYDLFSGFVSRHGLCCQVGCTLCALPSIKAQSYKGLPQVLVPHVPKGLLGFRLGTAPLDNEYTMVRYSP